MGNNQNKVNKAADLVKNAVLDLNETEIMTVLNELLQRGFIWSNTPQGSKYWTEVSESLSQAIMNKEELT